MCVAPCLRAAGKHSPQTHPTTARIPHFYTQIAGTAEINAEPATPNAAARHIRPSTLSEASKTFQALIVGHAYAIERVRELDQAAT